MSAVGVLAVFVWGCGGKIPPTRYYTLKFPPPLPASDPKTPMVVEIEPFHAEENLRDDRIVYYEAPTQFSFYEYHRWDPDPATLVGEMAKRRLREMSVFAHVRPAPSHEPSDYLLKGSLMSFEELDYGPASRVRVGLDLRLVRNRDHKTVWSDRRQVERPIDEKGVVGVVNALSAASDDVLGQMLPGLAAEVEREFKEPSAKSQ